MKRDDSELQWPPGPVDKHTVRQTKTRLLERTKEYLLKRTSDTQIRTAIERMRKKHLHVMIFAEPQDEAIPEDVADTLLENEGILPFERVEIAESIQRLKFEIRMHFLRVLPQRKRNDVLQYTRMNAHEIVHIEQGSIAEILNSLTFSDRCTVAHTMSMKHIETDGHLCNVWNKHIDAAVEHPSHIDDGGADELSDDAQLYEDLGISQFNEQDGFLALEDAEDDDEMFQHPLAAQYEYELLKELHMKLVRGKLPVAIEHNFE